LPQYQQAIEVWTRQAEQAIRKIGQVADMGGALSSQIASATQTGLLSSTDWTTFNNKQPPGAYLLDAPSDGSTYGRLNGAWSVVPSPTFGNLTETGSSILTIIGGTGAVQGSGTTIQVKAATTSQNGFLTSTDWNTFNNKQSTKQNVRAVVLCTAFTPPVLGADSGEVVMPFATDGTSVNYSIKAIRLRVGVAGGAPAVTIEKSTGSGVFSASTVGTVTLSSGAYEGSNTTSLGTINSGDKLRFNVGTIASTQNWTVIVEIAAP
jgi:hypothetical protein